MSKKKQITIEEAKIIFAETLATGRKEYDDGRKDGDVYAAANAKYAATHSTLREQGMTQEEVWAIVKSVDPDYAAMIEKKTEAKMQYITAVLDANESIRQYERKFGAIPV